MTYPTTFANLAAGNQPLSQVDTMFQVVGQQGAIPCTVSGTANAITLTPGTNYYAPTALTNGLMLSFQATANSTAAITVQLLGLGALNLYTASGVQAGSGRILSGSHYILQYWGDLNSSSGGWLIVNDTANNATVAYSTAFAVGTFSALATTTLNFANGYLQYLVNNTTSLSVVAPTTDGAMLMQITNGVAGGLAGGLGLTFVTGTALSGNFAYTTAGDAYVTTTGAIYLANIWKINGTASYFLRRLL
jgi:hypothetical protein